MGAPLPQPASAGSARPVAALPASASAMVGNAAGAQQLGFFDDSIEANFRRFNAKHPEVYRELADVCRAWVRRGGAHWSVDAAYHVLRFQRRMAGLPDENEVYKLNNNFTSLYARLLMEQEPELDGLFEVRVRARAG